MVGRTPEKRRILAQRQECRGRPIPDESATKEFGCQQELGEGDCEGEGNAGRRFQNDSIPFALTKKLHKESVIQTASSIPRFPKPTW